MSRMILVVNPTAGAGRSLRVEQAVLDTLRAASHEVDVVETAEGAQAIELARAVDAQDTLVSLGGDGLHALLATGAMDSGCLLAPLPGGRGNDFARALGIPLDPVTAAARLAIATQRCIDVGLVNDRVFLGVASVGYDTLANTFANESRVVKGPLVYAWGGAKALALSRLHPFTVTVDGETLTTEAFNVAIGSTGRYGGGMLACPDARIDDGLLDVVTIGAVHRAVFPLILLRAFRGTHVHHRQVSSRRGRVVQVSADEPLVLFADGDPVATLPVDVSAREGALRILA